MNCPPNYETPCLGVPAPSLNSYALQVCGQGLYNTRFNQSFADTIVCFGANPVLPNDNDGQALSPDIAAQILEFLRQQFLNVLTNESFVEVPLPRLLPMAACVLTDQTPSDDGTIKYSSAATYLAVPGPENSTAAEQAMYCGCITPWTYFPNLAASAQTQQFVDGLLKPTSNTSCPLAAALVPSLLLTSIFCLLLGFLFGQRHERKHQQDSIRAAQPGYGTL